MFRKRYLVVSGDYWYNLHCCFTAQLLGWIIVVYTVHDSYVAFCPLYRFSILFWILFVSNCFGSYNIHVITCWILTTNYAKLYLHMYYIWTNTYVFVYEDANKNVLYHNIAPCRKAANSCVKWFFIVLVCVRCISRKNI